MHTGSKCCYLSTDPGSVCDSPIASGPSESATGKRVLRAAKTRTGHKDGMCLKNLCTVMLVIGHISTDPGSVCDSPIASVPSESVHTTAGKRGLKTSTKTRTGPKDGMCLNSILCTVITHRVKVLFIIVSLSTDPGSVCDSPIASGPSESAAGKRVLRAAKTRTGHKDCMCLKILCTVKLPRFKVYCCCL